MNASLSANTRDEALAGFDDAATWSTTPTLRLLEVTCRLTRTQLDAMLNAPPAAPRRLARPDTTRQTAYQAINTIVCSVLLSAALATVLAHIA